MPRKERSFAAKVAHAKDRTEGVTCPVCGGARKHYRMVQSERKPRSGAWGYRERTVLVCKCNRAEHGLE